MVEHLVMFKFKAEIGEVAIERAAAGLRALKDKVPGIIHITAGQNFTTRGQGHQLGLVVRLKDKTTLESYSAHPEHRAVVDQLIKPFTDNIIAIDYEF